jgi:hypothetical protein
MKVLTAALGAACVLALTATTASADIACNREGDCWHVKERPHYHHEWGIVVHPEGWRWADRDHDRYRWREHEGRGYWHDGAWIEF